MRVPAKTLALLAVAALAMALAGCGQKGCSRSQVVIVPAAESVLSGATVDLRGYIHTDVYGRGLGYGEITGKRDEVMEASTWTASGPGPFGLTTSGGDRAGFTAAEPGTYTVECRSTRPVVAHGSATIVVLATSPADNGAPTTRSIPHPPDGAPVTVLDTFNELGVRPGGTAPSFTLARPATLLTVQTYHYLGGGAPEPGTLALAGPAGRVYGPWRAFGLMGRNDTANALWNADPIVKLPVGTYTVVDSHPATWSSNDTARGVGFTRVVVIFDR